MTPERKIILPKRNLILPNRTLFIPSGPSKRRQRGFMRLMPSVGLWGRKPFYAQGVDFDGSTYCKTGSGFTGAADGKQGIFSCWFRLDGGNSTTMKLVTATTTAGGTTLRFNFERFSNNTLYCDVYSVGGTINWTCEVASVTSGAAWHHWMMVWDSNFAGRCRAWYDGSLVTPSSSSTQTLDYTWGDFCLGAFPNGSNKLNGCLAEVYYAPNQYLDIHSDVPADPAKSLHFFRSPTGKPVDLGSDGSKPTGTAPYLLYRVNKGGVANDILTNRTGLESMTVTAGTLALSSDSPSD